MVCAGNRDLSGLEIQRDSLVRISVVVPAHDDQAALDRTLKSLRNQTVKPHEIIVVDDGSESPLSVPRGVRLVRIDRIPCDRGSSEAKNTGARHARGDWLAFSDDDIVHEAAAIESLIAKINSLERHDVLINVLSVPTGQPYPKERTEAIKQGKSAFSEQHMGVINRDYFMRLGEYDAQSFRSWGYNNQDLSLRVVRAGGHVTSNVVNVRTGDLLTCEHTRPSNHDSVAAKADFRAKYGEDWRVGMLVEGQREAS